MAGATPSDVAARKGKNAVAVYLTNVVSGTQPTPSRAELIDNRTFAWTEGGLDNSSIAVDVQAKEGKAAAPPNQVELLRVALQQGNRLSLMQSSSAVPALLCLHR